MPVNLELRVSNISCSFLHKRQKKKDEVCGGAVFGELAKEYFPGLFKLTTHYFVSEVSVNWFPASILFVTNAPPHSSASFFRPFSLTSGEEALLPPRYLFIQKITCPIKFISFFFLEDNVSSLHFITKRTFSKEFLRVTLSQNNYKQPHGGLTMFYGGVILFGKMVRPERG